DLERRLAGVGKVDRLGSLAKWPALERNLTSWPGERVQLVLALARQPRTRSLDGRVEALGQKQATPYVEHSPAAPCPIPHARASYMLSRAPAILVLAFAGHDGLARRAKCTLDDGLLGLQLSPIAHVLPLAAPALAEIRARRLRPNGCTLTE